MGLYRNQKEEKDIETEWKYLRHNITGSTINTYMENYENSRHAQRVESIIHFLIELYRNWGEDSETEWRGPKKKIGGTKSKSNCPIHLKWSLLHICAPPYLHGEAVYDSRHLKVHDCTSHAKRM